MKNRFVCLLLCLVFLSVGSLSWSQDSQVQEKRFAPVADTYVSDRSSLIRLSSERNQERCVNCGSSESLRVVRGRHARTGGHIYWSGALIQFDLSRNPSRFRDCPNQTLSLSLQWLGRADLDPPDAQELDGVRNDVAEAVRSV